MTAMPGGDAIARLQQFVVRHERCRGQVLAIPPSGEDLVEGGAWVSIRCSGCGDSIRELIDYESQLRNLARQAGIEWDELQRLSSTEAGLEELRHRLYAWPGMVPMILAWRRRAAGGERPN